jgi:hypothetical protein
MVSARNAGLKWMVLDYKTPSQLYQRDHFAFIWLYQN